VKIFQQQKLISETKRESGTMSSVIFVCNRKWQTLLSRLFSIVPL